MSPLSSTIIIELVSVVIEIDTNRQLERREIYTQCSFIHSQTVCVNTFSQFDMLFV